MKSVEYKQLIAKIIRHSLRQYYPGLKGLKSTNQRGGDDAASFAARAIHARMYGAHVDGVDSPIWRDYVDNESPPPNLPKVDASELLKQDEADENG